MTIRIPRNGGKAITANRVTSAVKAIMVAAAAAVSSAEVPTTNTGNFKNGDASTSVDFRQERRRLDEYEVRFPIGSLFFDCLSLLYAY